MWFDLVWFGLVWFGLSVWSVVAVAGGIVVLSLCGVRTVLLTLPRAQHTRTRTNTVTQPGLGQGQGQARTWLLATLQSGFVRITHDGKSLGQKKSQSTGYRSELEPGPE